MTESTPQNSSIRAISAKATSDEDLPRISLVTPAFKPSIPYLREAFASAQSQDYPAFEHIVADGGSGEETIKALNEIGGTRWISEPDRGISDGLNKAIAMTSGDVVGWLNTDDRYLPGALRKVAEFFRDHPDTDILYGDYRFIDPAGNLLKNRKEHGVDRFILFYLHMHYMPSCATFFHRRVFEAGQYFDANCLHAMDYDLNLRLYNKGFKFAHLPAYLAEFRVHPNSNSTANQVVQTAELEELLLKHDPFLRSLPPYIRKPTRWSLRLAARAKRTAIRAALGHYFVQKPLLG